MTRTAWLNLCLLVILCNSGAYAQLTAAFTANTQQGCAPVIVQFNDASKGNPTWWRWDLGNGTISFLQHPATTYFNAGTYTVKLVAGNDQFKDSVTLQAFITVQALPTVNFSTSANAGCYPLPVQLTDASDPGSGTINKWLWDFGDGTISTDQNPQHMYASAGSFNISLRVTNSNGCEQTLTRSNYVNISTGVKAGFRFSSPNSCMAPAAVKFTNTSSGTGTLSYAWDFGDGQTSTDKDPVHTYSTNGSYTVKLVTRNSTGCKDSVIKTGIINIGNTKADFNTPATICAGMPVNISNASVPLPSGSAWTFGDGTGSTDLHPVKTYAAPGRYTIKLIADFGTCKSELSKTVEVLAKPAAGFNSTNAAGCKAPHTADFTAAVNGIVGWEWFFGDGSKGNGSTISHTYTKTGVYNVKLVVTNAAGCTDTLEKKQFVQIAAPEVKITNLPVEGCVPLKYEPVVTVQSADPIVSWTWNFGDGTTVNQLNTQHTYTTAGTYTVSLTYTTAGGCSNTITVNDAVRAGNKPIPAFTGYPTDVCAAMPVNFQDKSTGAGIDKWNWYFSDGGYSDKQNPTHYFTDTGYFNVKLVVASNGCKDSLSILKMVHVKPPIADFVAGFDCNNRLSRNFTDRSRGATSWFWQFGDGQTSTDKNPSHTYAGAGNYTVRLTVSNGECSHFTERLITVIDEKANFTVSGNDICKGSAVALKAVAGNAQQISAYSWIIFRGTAVYGRPTGQQLNFTFNDAGSYSIRLIITDRNGCKDSLTKSDIILVNGPTAAFAPVNPTVCPGSIITFTDKSVSDGTNPITEWKWNYGDGHTEVRNTAPFEHKFETPGEYNITLTVTDSKGCKNARTIAKAVNISRPLVKFYAPDTLSCAGQPVRFIDQTVSNAGQYSWDFGDGSNSAATAPSHAYKDEGLYTIRLVVKDRAGCADSMIRTAYIAIRNPKAAFDVDKTTTNCPPLVSAFTNQSQHYKKAVWDFGDGTGSNIAAPSHFYTYPGTYRAKLLITSVGGCQDSAFATMEIKGPTGSFSYDKVNGCVPTSIKFTGVSTNAAKFIWDFNDGVTNANAGVNTAHAYDRMGVYLPKMILEDPQGCRVPIPGKDTIHIFDVEAALNNDIQQLCDSGKVIFNDLSTSNDLITKYEWTFGDGNAITGQRNPVHYYKTTGLHPVSLKVTTRMGCTDEAQLPLPIRIVAAPVAGINSADGACIPAELSFQGKILKPDTSPLQWKWDFRNGNTAIGQEPSPVKFLSAGKYAVQLIVTNSSGCADTVVKNIQAYPLPVLDAGPDAIICRGKNITLQASGADNYQWMADNTLGCTNCATPLASPLESRMYKLKGSNNFGCEAIDSVKISVKQPFTIQAHLGGAICKGESLQLFANGAEQYEWSPSAGLSKTNADNPHARPDATTTYRVVGKDDYKCFTDTAYVPITVYPWPAVNAGEDMKVGLGSSVQLKASVSEDAANIKWTPANGLSCVTCIDPVATPKQTTIYTLEAINKGGCLSKDMVTVHVFCDNSNLFVPNTFSPNSDGHNDVFYPRGKGSFTIRAFRVFNRWGDLVYERSNFSPNDANSGWDGMHKGRPAPSDVYIYTLEIICNNSTIFNEKGNVTLIR